MGARNRFGKLREQRFSNFGKFRRVHHLEDIFNFVEEHDFFRTVGLGPVPEQTKNNLNHRCQLQPHFPGTETTYLLSQGRVLFQELDNAVS